MKSYCSQICHQGTSQSQSLSVKYKRLGTDQPMVTRTSIQNWSAINLRCNTIAEKCQWPLALVRRAQDRPGDVGLVDAKCSPSLTGLVAWPVLIKPEFPHFDRLSVTSFCGPHFSGHFLPLYIPSPMFYGSCTAGWLLVPAAKITALYH